MTHAAWGLFLGIAMLLAPASGQDQFDALGRAQALVEALFPDLMGQGLRVDAGVSVGFDQPWASSNPLLITVRAPGVPESSPPMLRGHFLYGGSGQYDSVSFTGQVLASGELERIVARNRSAQDWTLNDVRSALASEHAKYGPDAEPAFASLIALDRWSQALGPVTLTEVRFMWRLPFEDVPMKDAIIEPGWVVKLQGTAGRCYSLLFEPINGRPVSLRGLEC